MRKLILPAVLLSLLLSACKDNYGACEKAALDIANGVTAGMKTMDGLRVAGLITPTEESNVLGYLKFANDANAAFAVCAQTVHSSGSKSGSFTACAQTFSAALNNPTALALIKVSNPQAVNDIQ